MILFQEKALKLVENIVNTVNMTYNIIVSVFEGCQTEYTDQGHERGHPCQGRDHRNYLNS